MTDRDYDRKYARLSGDVRYVTDLSCPDLLHAALLRSPLPHAEIVAIKIEEALKIPGVAAVITQQDLDELDPFYGPFLQDQPVLAIGKVRYVGEPIAAVAACDEATAQRALAAIALDLRPLPPVPDARRALAPDAPPLFDPSQRHVHTLVKLPANGTWKIEPGPNEAFRFDYATGPVAETLHHSAHVFTDRFEMDGLSHMALEPLTAIAAWSDGNQRLELTCNNQDPFLLRDDLARIFGLKPSSVVVSNAAIGGGFGSKSYCKIEPIAALLSRVAGAPVRLALTLTENMLTTREHAATLELTTGVSADGKLTARRARVLLDGGAYSDASPSVAMRIGTRLNGPYAWQALEAQVKVVRTSTVPAGSYRSFGAPQATWASENQIDLIARRLGIDPVDFRLRNLLALGAEGAPGEATLDTDHAMGLSTIERAMGPAPSGPGQGRGYAIGVKGGGSFHRAAARIDLYPERVVFDCGISDIGQSPSSALAHAVAELLNVPLDKVHSITGNQTDKTPFNAGTHASTGSSVGSLALLGAVEQLVTSLKASAAERWHVDPDQVTLEDFHVRIGNYRYPLSDLLDARPCFSATYEAVGSSGWTPIWTAVDVEVDTETGAVRVLKALQGFDPGRALDLDACMGQIEGAAAQGLGQALFEALRFDADAMPINATPGQYRMPRVKDLAPHEALCLEMGRGPGAFGVKGVGESGNLALPAAIANAIHDATGKRVYHLPMTPLRIWRALQSDECNPQVFCACV